MHDEGPMDAARGCFITGPLFALATWAILIGMAYLVWQVCR